MLQEQTKSTRGIHLSVLVLLVLAGSFMFFGTPGCAQAKEHWGKFKADRCVAIGKRKFSAILWGIPFGQSWERACANMPANIRGQHFKKPARCVNTGLNMWGEFDVSDSSCHTHWGAFKRDACSIRGKRQFSAILWGIPPGVGWEKTCNKTPATIKGKTFPHPARCENERVNIWGEFDMNDASCKHPKSLAHSVSLHCLPGRMCVLTRPRYLDVYWAAPGEWDREAPKAGVATRARIDGFVRAVVASHYFDGLRPYGVGHASFAGSMEAAPACLRHFPVPHTADFVHIAGFASCEVAALHLHSTAGLVVNVFLLPRVKPEWVNAHVLGHVFRWGGCDLYGGYHSSSTIPPLPGLAFSVLPTISAHRCSGDFDSLTSVLSHEMVEAATDPDGFSGWRDSQPNDLLAKGPVPYEIGDMCDTMYFTPSKRFHGGKLSPYWSNAAADCVFDGSLTSPPAPAHTGNGWNPTKPLPHIHIP